MRTVKYACSELHSEGNPTSEQRQSDGSQGKMGDLMLLGLSHYIAQA